MIEQQVSEYIASRQLFTSADKLLITLSGGTDSVAMTTILKKLGYHLHAAHCNFHLRGDDSDNDEAFVRELCAKWDIPLTIKHFDTKMYAEEQKISIQMAARDLRYNWFEALRKELALDYIAIAHNQDDSLETFFVNLSRGTGLKGLTGIAPKKGNIVRPILDIWRYQLADYLQSKKITFREDTSNASIKYKRNRIRHQIIPEFAALNPVFKETLKGNMEKLQGAYSLYQHGLQQTLANISKKQGDIHYLRIDLLRQHPASLTLLHESLAPYGFTHTQLQDIQKSLNAQAGKQFLTPSHVLYRDREFLVIQPQNKQGTATITITNNQGSCQKPISLKWQLQDNRSGSLPKTGETACLDTEKLQWPLLVRKWQPGDRFIPFGMSKYKKVSDFLIDNKVSRAQKDNTYVLITGKEICWLIGHRIDDRFKITENTDKIFRIDLL